MILHTTSENLVILNDKRLIENGKKSNTDHFVCHMVIHNLSKPNRRQNVNMIRASWIYFVDLHSWSTKWALFLDWRMNASAISPRENLNLNLILFELELEHAFDAWQSMGPAFFFSSRTWISRISKVRS